MFSDVRPGEAGTALLMLANIFLILICYSVIKTVREPLILLGGGAEVRAYAAAGQAVLLMGFVPFYGWFASRVDRVKLLVGVTLFFLVNIELFALAVASGVPYVGVVFYIWVGIFSISLIAQFWSYANDIYSKDAGNRLFPIIALGMTAGPPLGSLVAARLFGQGVEPQVIIQVSAALLLGSLVLYLVVNARETRRATAPEAALAAGGGFRLVWRSEYLRLIALLIILLNVVNTTGEYLRASLLTSEAAALKAANPAFNEAAYIGAFAGNYQFWTNVLAFLLQAFVTSRLVKYQGLRGALLALPLVALGGYTLRRGRRWPGGHERDQERRKRDRLFDHEHGAPALVAADVSRGEVQGEAGDRYVFRARRRSAVGRDRVPRHCGHTIGRVWLRSRQRGADTGLDRRGTADFEAPPGACGAAGESGVTRASARRVASCARARPANRPLPSAAGAPPAAHAGGPSSRRESANRAVRACPRLRPRRPDA